MPGKVPAATARHGPFPGLAENHPPGDQEHLRKPSGTWPAAGPGHDRLLRAFHELQLAGRCLPRRVRVRAHDLQPGPRRRRVPVRSRAGTRAHRNRLLVITRWKVGPEDCAVLNSFRNIRLTVLVTHSNISHAKIEPVDSNIAAESLRILYEHAERYRTILYWQPIVSGLNDSDGWRR
ncbi:hypothetical protein ABT144_11205 [Streptomyces sp. NPDC002039]|uniref:hypothetical protein n=1 Tax=Streptomyces sp. NPDC002039 TaxID=3154660 RepID=UPI003323935C